MVGCVVQAQAVNFAEVGHAHFDDSCLVLRCKVQECFRQADFVIQVALCFQRFKSCGKHQCNHFLCSCLSNAAGYANQNRRELFPVVCCNLQQCRSGIRHNDTRTAFNWLIGYRCNCSIGNCFLYELMSVKICPTQC